MTPQDHHAGSIANQMLEYLTTKYENVTYETDLYEAGLVDSIYALQVVSFIEDQFDVSITGDDIDLANFRSCSSIVQMISKKKA